MHHEVKRSASQIGKYEEKFSMKKKKKKSETLNQGGVLKTDSKLKNNSKFVSQ